MYYIYHIPGVKIGVTSLTIEERAKQQGYSTVELLEQHEDIMVASERELELQDEYGYPRDSVPYHHTHSLGRIITPKKSKASRRNFATAGAIGSRVLTDKKRASNKINISKATEAAKFQIQCNYCGKMASVGNHSRWHGENCKHKTNEVEQSLPKD